MTRVAAVAEGAVLRVQMGFRWQSLPGEWVWEVGTDGKKDDPRFPS